LKNSLSNFISWFREENKNWSRGKEKGTAKIEQNKGKQDAGKEKGLAVCHAKSLG